MKKIIAILCIGIATFSFANDMQRGPQQGGEPPKEAIEVCKNKDTGTTCEVETPRGDTLSGTCQYTPDEKYFVCMPSDGHRPPKNR
jgi:hypothetical protein